MPQLTDIAGAGVTNQGKSTRKNGKRGKRGGKGEGGSRMKIKRPTKKPADMISEDNSIYQTSRIQKMTSQSRDQCAFYSLFTTTMHALAIMHSTQKGIQLCNHFFFYFFKTLNNRIIIRISKSSKDKLHMAFNHLIIQVLIN